MTICNNCMGDGSVLGNWTREPCPECNGTGVFEKPEDEFDGDAAGFFIAVAGLVVCLVLAAIWPVFEFFMEVLL